MKFDQLSYFLEAAKTEHIGKAAKILAISPSAVSHSIAALEEELGRPLFQRRGKNIQITESGRQLMERAQRILSEVESVKSDLASESLNISGHYRLAAAHVVCSRLLMPAWAKIQTRFPEISSEVFSLRSAQIVSGVASGQLDFGLCFSPQSQPNVAIKPILSGTLLIAVANNHPLMKQPVATRFKKISEYPAVLPKSFQGIDVCVKHSIFEKFGIKPKPQCLIDNYEVGAKLISQSDYWGYLPDWIIEQNRESIVPLGKPKDWVSCYTIAAVWPEERESNLVVQLREILESGRLN